MNLDEFALLSVYSFRKIKNHKYVSPQPLWLLFLSSYFNRIKKCESYFFLLRLLEGGGGHWQNKIDSLCKEENGNIDGLLHDNNTSGKFCAKWGYFIARLLLYSSLIRKKYIPAPIFIKHLWKLSYLYSKFHAL